MACSWGPSPSTPQVPGLGPGPDGLAARAFSLHPPFLPPSRDSFFLHLPHQTRGRVRVITHWVYYNPNTMKSYKNYLQNTQHMVLRNCPTLSIGTERLACLNNPQGVQLGTPA